MDPTPTPVRIVDLGATVWSYLDKAEDAYRLAFWFGAVSVFVCAFLLTATLVVVGLRR